MYDPRGTMTSITPTSTPLFTERQALARMSPWRLRLHTVLRAIYMAGMPHLSRWYSPNRPVRLPARIWLWLWRQYRRTWP